jgi:nucleotide-binding universal stress UspA family protein
MPDHMKILIAHDGSPAADLAVDDLRLAGLPDDVEALVLSVTERWLPPPSFLGSGVPADVVAFSSGVEAVVAMARAVAEKIGPRFPGWRVHSEAATGSPAAEVIRRAEEWKARLIVTGSHGRSGLGRLLLGSVSQAIANRARSSVRIGRKAPWRPEPAAGDEARPLRILVGVDGSHGSEVAVKEVAERRWPPGTEVRIITCVGPFPTVAGLAGGEADAVPAEPAFAEEVSRAKALAELSARPIERARLRAAISVCIGDPRRRLVAEAESWKADAIFLGSTGLSRIERIVLGSVASAIAARAGSTVEIVRPPVEG